MASDFERIAIGPDAMGAAQMVSVCPEAATVCRAAATWIAAESLEALVGMAEIKGIEAMFFVGGPAGSLVAESFRPLVDERIGKPEGVIGRVGEIPRDVPGVGGGAILGDGRVGSIFDQQGIFRMVQR